MVCVPGYTGDINLFHDVAVKLQLKCRVLLFDPQGSGLTQDNNDDLTVEIMARNTHALYTELGFTNPVLMGFALGAGVVLSIAHQFPESYGKLALISAVKSFNENSK